MKQEITASQKVFSKAIVGLGCIELRHFDSIKDTETLHSWVTQSYAAYWGMLSKSLEEVRAEYSALQANTNYDVFIGCVNGKTAFLVEKYKANTDRISHYYSAKASDYGMHILVGPPPQQKIKGFTWHVFSTVLEFFFEQPQVNRIVVEPDIRNEKIHILNKKAGFRYQKEIDLPEKRAFLAFCEPQDFQIAKQAVYHDALQANSGSVHSSLDLCKAHLEPKAWAKANSALVRKALSEFSHELLLLPCLVSTDGIYDTYRLTADNPKIIYQFKAKLRVLEHWDIEETSIVKFVNGQPVPLDALTFITDFVNVLEIPDHLLAVYLEEISSTLSSAAFKYTHGRYTSKQLAQQSFQTIEHAMTEGHPCFVANNGRIGFNNLDYIRYAPEAYQHFKIYWLAGHNSKTNFTATTAVDYNAFMRKEIGVSKLVKFNTVLETLGLDSAAYVFIPVHPWQWNHKIQQVFSADIANQYIVFLGESEDAYSAQQSIRTLYNETHPEKMYTKTALSILNMGFTRGLSPHYMKSTPHITTWITSLLEDDPYLKKNGFAMLGEVATVGFENTYYAALDKTNAQHKLLSALWRESPYSKLGVHETAMTMAGLLHLDKAGDALLVALIKASPYTVTQWLQKYLQAYLSPLLHCFYKYGFVFMPHGENIILALKQYTPVRILMKDITEEVVVFNPDLELPKHVKRLYVETDDAMQVLSIFTDVFDCFFRYMGPILEKQLRFSQHQFWKQVALCIQKYQAAHPEYNLKYERYDLFTPKFGRCCLNRLQLRNTQQMLNLSDPIASLIIEGELQNPIAKFKKNLSTYKAVQTVNHV